MPAQPHAAQRSLPHSRPPAAGRDGASASGRARLGRAIPSVVALIVMGTVLLFIGSTFDALVDPAALTVWLGYMWGCMTLMAAKLLIALVPPLRAAVPRPASNALGRISAVAFSLGIAASPWVLMPPADDLLRLLMIVLCMWYVAMVIILNDDRLSLAAAVATVVSMAAFALLYDIAYALPLAGFLVMEGVALVMIRRTIWRSNEALETALALTRNERDAKTRFIAAASHDLQQPLQAARLYFDQALASTDPVQRTRAAAGAHKAFSSTGALIEGMLDHLRLEAGAMPVRPTPLPLADLFAATALEHHATLEAAGLALRTGATRLTVLADERLAGRIMANLVGNAARHSRGTRLLLAARRRGDTAEIWVIDNGAGVAGADAAQLFDDYFQSSRGGSTAGGFGLGLASARRMAALMDGTLHHFPGWQGGAAFVLRLPLASPDRD